MSAKQFVFDSRGQMVKMSGWFSWRHQGREEHDAARERYLATHASAAARQRRAQHRRNRLAEGGSR